jgi:catechol 2,3-dioxygenase-like lactoylglutathione lyase family enzyme
MRSHLSLSVQDVPRAVDFYTRLFGVAPQKQTSRYAKFDLTEPALNFSLVEGAEPSRVSHLGIEAANAGEFAALGERLRTAGIASREERDTNCCYARQDKLWFRDPDGNPWEVFLVHEQLPVSEAEGQGPCGVPMVGDAPRDATAKAACCG